MEYCKFVHYELDVDYGASEQYPTKHSIDNLDGQKPAGLN